MQVPNTEVKWKRVAQEFEDKWNFPHCIGAMDGKHVLIQPPVKSGSYFYNYKHSFSIVLLAVVDADYKFIYVDIGCNGRVSDGGVFKNSSLSKALEENTLNVPPPQPLLNQSFSLPYTLVADDAFPLKGYIQKPFSQAGLTQERRIYNYRLSRARRIVENAFGILANRFRIFREPIPLQPEKVEVIVLACCCLHNYLRTETTACSVYTPRGSLDYEDPKSHDVTPGAWRQENTPRGFISPPRLRGCRQMDAAIFSRDSQPYPQKYFTNENIRTAAQFVHTNKSKNALREVQLCSSLPRARSFEQCEGKRKEY